MTAILRYQDRQGRGPFCPGVPALWADASGHSTPDVFEDFPDIVDILIQVRAKRFSVGCACEGMDGINAYFTAAEQNRLADLGYRLHRVPTSAVILRSPSQVVFVHRRPLRTLPRFRP